MSDDEGRSAGASEGGEDGLDGRGVGDDGADGESCAAAIAGSNVGAEGSFEEEGPIDASEWGVELAVAKAVSVREKGVAVAVAASECSTRS